MQRWDLAFLMDFFFWLISTVSEDGGLVFKAYKFYVNTLNDGLIDLMI